MFTLLCSINLLTAFLPNHPNVTCDEAPSWVVEIAPSEASEIHSSQRYIQNLLLDKQENIETKETYYRSVYKVLKGGTEYSSTQEVEFDPTYENIAINELTVFRDGVKVEPKFDIRILQRELELENNIVNGYQYLHFILGDVREGDIVELAYTVKGKNPVFENHFSDSRALSSAAQIEKLHFRYLHDKDRHLTFKTFNTEICLEDRAFDETLRESSVLLSPAPCRESNVKSDTPYFYMPYPWLQVSDCTSWQAVSEWGRNLFTQDHETAPLQEITNQWQNQFSTAEEKILAALRFVQNEISYFGISDSIYSHTPHSPLFTLQQRFGDCKDKTLLLQALLKELGIASTPALVNVYCLDTLQTWLPSSRAFNHAILHLSLNGRDYWLDPTKKYQAGSLEDCSEGYYGAYLLLNGAEDCFRTPEKKWGLYGMKSASHYTLTENKKTLQVTTQFQHRTANSLRAAITREGTDGLSKRYQSAYEKWFGSAEIWEPLTLHDDLQTNTITTTESYLLSDALDEDNEFEIITDIENYLPTKVSLSRKEPLAIDYPNLVEETIRITSDQKQHFQAKEGTYEHPAFCFKYKRAMDGNDLVLTFSYEAKSDHINPSDFKSLRDLLLKITQELSYWHKYEVVPIEVPETQEEIKFSQQEELFGTIVVVWLFACIAFLVIRKSRKSISDEELSSDLIKKKWRTAFWIHQAHKLLFIPLFIIGAMAENALFFFALLPILAIQIVWTICLYHNGYKKKGTKFLGLAMALMTLGILNPFNLYLLIRSIKLYRYNRTWQKR